MGNPIDKVLAIDFETANGHRTSACSVGMALFDYETEQLIERRHQLINPKDEFAYWNVAVHGITEQDVADAPTFAEVMPVMNEIIKAASIVVVHNAPFDIDVLVKSANHAGVSFDPFSFCCTLALSRQLMPELKNHKLNTVAAAFHLGDFQHHKADADAEICGRIFLKFAKAMEAKTADDIEQMSGVAIGKADPTGAQLCHAKGRTHIRQKKAEQGSVHAEVHNDQFVGKTLVFTGVFDTMSRKEAQKTASDRGGTVGSAVTKKTDYLVYGVQDLRSTKGHEKSNKQVKAEELISIGIPITVLSETEYLKLIGIGESSQVPIVEFQKVGVPCKAKSSKPRCQKLESKQKQPIWIEIQQFDYQVRRLGYKDTIDEQFVRQMPGQVPLSEIPCPIDSPEAIHGYVYFSEGRYESFYGDCNRALRLLDCARYKGFAQSDLYIAYYYTYNRIEDYESSIRMTQEAIDRGISPRYFTERLQWLNGLLQSKRQKQLKLEQRQHDKLRFKKLYEKRKTEITGYLESCSSAVAQLDDDGNVIAEYASVRQASEITEIHPKSISNATLGKQKTAGGYVWKKKYSE